MQAVALVTQELIQATVIVAFLALVANRVIEALCTPIFERLKLDKFWLLYVSWVVGGILVWLSGQNLFAAFIGNQLAGQILTALVAGGGANLIHELFGALVGLQKKYNEATKDATGLPK